MGKERQGESTIRQKAIPIPEGFFNPEAIKRALQLYAAARREDRFRFRQTNKRPQHWFEPLNSRI